MKYHAFISYSHRDKIWGDWLHQALERYKVPPYLIGRPTSRGEPVPGRVYPVFRDREELPTAVDLGTIINHALEQSRYLIVICSPASARSQWVNQEILAFKRLGRENRVLAIIVDGEPNAADGKPGFSVDDECFPPALKFKLGPDGHLSDERTEPIAADARPHADGKPHALLKLLAGVLGVNYDDLRRRDETARRRRQRIAMTIATTLTLVFACLSAISIWQWRVATERRLVAEQRLYQSCIALASGSLKDGRVTLARQALWRAPTTLRNWEWGYLLRQVYPSAATFSLPSSNHYYAAWNSADATHWAVTDGDQLVAAHTVPGGVPSTHIIELASSATIDVSTDGRRALITRDSQVELVDLDSGQTVRVLTAPNEIGWQRAFFWDRAGTQWIAITEDKSLIRDLATGATVGQLSAENSPSHVLAAGPAGVALVYHDLAGNGGLLNADGQWIAPLDAPLIGANFAAFNPDQSAAVFMTGDGGVWLLERSAAEPEWQSLRPQVDDLSFRNRLPSYAAFSPDGQKLWFISRQKLYTYDRSTTELSELILPSGFAPTQLAVSAQTVAVGTDHGQVVFFSAEGEQVISEGLGHEGNILALAASANNSAPWVSLGADGTLQLWPAPTPPNTDEVDTLPPFPILPAGAAGLRAATSDREPAMMPLVMAAHRDEVEALALNAAGDRLVSGGNDGQVRIWSVADQTLLLTIKAPGDMVAEARFGADPRQLGVLADDRGFNAYRLSIIWTAEDWIKHPWSPELKRDADEAAAYAAWQQHEFLK